MTRLLDAWRALERERRLVAAAALGLFLSMFLPWYSKTATVVEKNKALSAESSLNAFQAFSWVEAAVLLISAGVLAMLFARGERRDFNLPGGDGFATMLAGAWAAILIFYRLLDKPGLQGNEKISATVGVKWGIFIALLVALGLLYAGAHLRTSERSRGDRGPFGKPPGPAADDAMANEPAPGSPGRATARASVLEAERNAPPASPPATAAGIDRAAEGRRPRYPPAPDEQSAAGEQMSLEDSPPPRE
jgi:hypothetical protein